MSDEERERMAAGLERAADAGWQIAGPYLRHQLAAQLRADGERIKALEAGFTPQTAAAFLVDEVLQKSTTEAAAIRRRMIKAGMRVKVPHLTRWVRWALINVVLLDLAKERRNLAKKDEQ